MADLMATVYEQVMPFISVMNMQQWGFSFFDAGSWAYSSVTTSTLAPILFVRRLNEQIPEMNDTKVAPGIPHFAIPNAASLWVFMIAVSTLLAGFICPVLGAWVDRYNMRKVTTYATSAAAVFLMTIFAYTTHTTNWLQVLVIIGSAMVFMSVSHCFYNSLLVLVTEESNLVKVSCLQSSIGGFAAALLLTILGLADETNASLERDFVIHCFLVAMVWFIIFAIPMWLWLEEVQPDEDDKSTMWESLRDSWLETLQTMKNTEMMKYLLAMMLFNDANSTLHSVYLVYAAQMGIDTHILLLGAVLNRWLCGMSSLAWLGMAQFLGPRATMMLSIALTAVAITFCAWMTTAVHFFVVIFFMTLSHTGSYIFSRVLMASITPPEKASHNFGFMGMINRMAGFLGPFFFTTVSLSVDTRAGFLSLVLLAMAGMVIMTTVDFEKGREFHDFQNLSSDSPSKKKAVLKPSNSFGRVVPRKSRGDGGDGEEQGANESDP